MPFPEGMVFFDTCLAHTMLLYQVMSMFSHNSPLLPGKYLAAALCLLPALASAHPGHLHPGEEDEFDALRANFLHLHGFLEIGLATLALASVGLFIMNRNRPVRIAAAITFSGSLAVIAAL